MTFNTPIFDLYAPRRNPTPQINALSNAPRHGQMVSAVNNYFRLALSKVNDMMMARQVTRMKQESAQRAAGTLLRIPQRHFNQRLMLSCICMWLTSHIWSSQGVGYVFRKCNIYILFTRYGKYFEALNWIPAACVSTILWLCRHLDDVPESHIYRKGDSAPWIVQIMRYSQRAAKPKVFGRLFYRRVLHIIIARPPAALRS